MVQILFLSRIQTMYRDHTLLVVVGCSTVVMVLTYSPDSNILFELFLIVVDIVDDDICNLIH